VYMLVQPLAQPLWNQWVIPLLHLGVSEATLGAAAISGTTSAVNAAIQGKDPGKILEAGAIGTVSGALGSEVSQAVGGGVLPGETGDIPSGGVGELTGSTAAGKIAGSAAGSGASSFARSELSGSNLQQALRQGEIGAATGAITSAIGEGYKGAGGLSDDATTALFYCQSFCCSECVWTICSTNPVYSSGCWWS
jgi:hypothetical protein